MGLIPGSGRSPGVGNGNPLQYSCLENFMDRGAWQVTVHGLTESDTDSNVLFLMSNWEREQAMERITNIPEVDLGERKKKREWGLAIGKAIS